MKILDGRELAGFIKERQAREVRSLRQTHGITPKLAIIVTIDHPVIDVYVRLKKHYGADILIAVDIHRVRQSEVPALLTKLNQDDSVHGIITQLPLADPVQTEEIVNLVAPAKDVDALGDPNAPWPPHSDALQGAGENRTEVYTKYSEGNSQTATQQGTETARSADSSTVRQARGVRGSWFDPATPMAILWLLSGYNVELAGKHILLIGRGKLVGAPLERMLRNSGHEVFVADRGTPDLKAESLKADVIITAAGSPAILFPDMVKQGAVVVDAGVASEDGKTVGDVAPELYNRDDLTITPAKGGVGPLTVCALFDNVIRAARGRAGND